MTLRSSGYFGLKREEIEEAQAGDLVAVSGKEDINVGETVTPLPGSPCITY